MSCLLTKSCCAGSRKVSALTPEKRDDKRARDREAQRKIRARAKEYIDRLENELEQLKSHKWRDRTIQDLLRRNEAIERELVELKATIKLLGNAVPCNSSIPHHPQLREPAGYSTPPWEVSNLLVGGEASCSPHGSQFLMNNEDIITHYAPQQCPSSNDQEESGNSPTYPVFPVMSSLSPASCTVSYNPASFYTTMANPNDGYY
jgi:hypothetical protein